MAESLTFSLRIVAVDHYMAAPIPGLDISYSSFHGGKVNEVPVIRIYGSTPAGQKTCLHVHRVFPYLYVPCADIHSQEEGDAYAHEISLAMEKALKHKSKTSSKRQHVHGCSLVRARKFYGYHSSEELFVKIFFYYPHDVSRAANLLLSGGVLDKCLQPHEAHIPFILQFLVDYNLYGMGHIHLSKMKFRHPVPDAFLPKKSINTEQAKKGMDPFTCAPTDSEADVSGSPSFDSYVWISSTVPADWMWPSPSDFDVSSNPEINSIKCQSLCQLEGDATVDEILNQQFKMYTSLSQTRTDVKMVQSLVPIWEEEYERTGMHELEIPSDPSKPLPEDVLRTLSLGPEFMNKYVDLHNELHNEAESPLCLTPLEKDVTSVQLMTSPNEANAVRFAHVLNNDDGESSECLKERRVVGSLSSQEEDGAIPSAERDANVKFSFNGELPASQMIEALDKKVADKDALGLLKWLATSQAADDINSDDELLRDTILSPFLPATRIEEVLEKANMDYESESQKECQDILDSVDDFVDFKDIKERADFTKNSRCPNLSSGDFIPQVDGAGDDMFTPPARSTEDFYATECKRNFDEACEQQVFLEDTLSGKKVVEDAHSSFNHKHKRKKLLWGSLPFSTNEKLKDESFCTDTKGPITTSPLSGYMGEHEHSSIKNVKTDICDGNETAPLVVCSVRDLMRRKRHHRVESLECSSQGLEKSLSEMKRKDNIFPRNLDFQVFPIDEPNKRPCVSLSFPPFAASLQEVYDVKATGDDSPGKLPILSRSGSSLVGSTADDGNFTSHKSDNSYGSGVATRSGNFLSTGPSYVTRSSLSMPGGPDSAAAIGHSKNSQEPRVLLLKSDFEDNTFAAERLEPTNAAASSCHQTAVGRDELNVKSGKEGRSSRELEHEMSPKKSVAMNMTTNINALNSGQSQGGDVPLVITNRQDMDLICLTFYRKSPATDWITGPSRKAFSDSFISHVPCQDKESHDGASGRALDDFLPFFMEDCQGEAEIQTKCITVNESTSEHEAAVGVPAHYQNDGSYSYLLTPLVSPPSSKNVKRWLSIGTSVEENTKLRKPTSHKGTSSTPNCSPSSSPDDYNKASTGSGSISHQPYMKAQGPQDNCDTNNVDTIRTLACNEETAMVQREGNSAKVKAYSDCSLDISQISGPGGRSKPTPLSQIGFRDPASVGAGQQLTLLSIEVQVASRGDLLPDPRFDAVNVITLAVHNDSDFDVELHVLLHSKAENCQRNLDGITGCTLLIFYEEKYLFDHFIKFVCSLDPDILMGWDVQGGSLGFLAERASYLGIGLLNSISRTPCETKIAAGDSEIPEKGVLDNVIPNSVIADPVVLEDAIIEDEWGRTHGSGVHVGGRIVLNVWRLMRGELKLNIYTIEAVAEAVLRRKIPYISYKVLTRWFSSGPDRARYRCIEYVTERAKLNLEILNQLDMINRTSELARVFGIDFFSVLSRGSQYRVESMYLRLAHTQNYLAISPGNHQVASQPAMECLPLVMEPESGFYADPVVVLDFQSLYPSMIIAYNLCYSTCLGNIAPSKANTLGVSPFSPDPDILRKLKDQILLTPNGVMYVPSKVRKGILPRLLEEILSTRIMVKQAMKKLSPSQQVLHRILNARQLALKLIANVTYGYTAAGFSGRMPCAELADSIVQCGRRTLEKAISFVNANDKWKAKVIYGDTDSMFVLLKGRSLEDAFKIGNEIASEITAMSPNPVALKMEKVYHPCFLLTKKRYVGYSYESPKQVDPVFDAKGIETVRRDTCEAVSKTMEQSLRLFFEQQDIFEVKAYLQRQWKRILSGRVSLQDFVFVKEVRLGTYRTRDSSLLPPAAIVATKAIRTDPRAEPRYGERVPYVVIHGEPGARLIDMVVDPLELLTVGSPYRLNDLYYINKQIIPALQRAFGLVGADLKKWFLEMPRPVRESFSKRPLFTSNPHRTRIDYYYLSKHCIICGELVDASTHLCKQCSQNKTAAVTAVVGRTSKLEREMQHLAAICRHCGGGDWLVESGVKCTSLACPVF
ncbi:DNA polymerase zeta catalytic subunit isoform X2 [Morus notabilis]|uniref:DNA polymerase zeta catalytic subunit isoform X2 n=1 Tax=Morus notabilis TaxID=981085 RepID=UPI000CED65EB|nr:DNA polymerase zeta catalytic subunit isoform X2 [Morus notabilis]